MKTIERHVDIAVPSNVAYAQWTQFEELPRIMGHVDAVEQVADDELRLQLDMMGLETRQGAKITEQIPDKRIAWRGVGGVEHGGCVTFHPLEQNRCRVMFQMDVDGKGFVGKAAEVLGALDKAVQDDLDDLCRFLEARGDATGRWEGEIPSPAEQTKQTGAGD